MSGPQKSRKLSAGLGGRRRLKLNNQGCNNVHSKRGGGKRSKFIVALTLPFMAVVYRSVPLGTAGKCNVSI